MINNKRNLTALVEKLVTNDIPHIQLQLERLDTQAKITQVLESGIIIALVGAAIAILAR